MRGSLTLYRIDTHIHSCLSPCASLDMSPVHIVSEALHRGLAMIAITDHNSAENVPAVMEAASGTSLCVLPGMEITTAEEVHVVALFEDLEGALSMQELVYAHLEPGENDPDLFGLQVVANALDEVESINTRLLIGATTLTIQNVMDAIHERNGMAIPAHIDRESYSVLGQLGFLPMDLSVDALEISRRMSLARARVCFPEYRQLPMITASDAHFLEEVGLTPAVVAMAEPHPKELKMAFRGLDGRGIVLAA